MTDPSEGDPPTASMSSGAPLTNHATSIRWATFIILLLVLCAQIALYFMQHEHPMTVTVHVNLTCNSVQPGVVHCDMASNSSQ